MRRRLGFGRRWRSLAFAFTAVLAAINTLRYHREASPSRLLLRPTGQAVALVIKNDVGFAGRHTRLILLSEVVKREREVHQFRQCAKTLGNKSR